ncbi:MAG: hypothetical protein HKN08_01405, partial [Gammaproteobacteria bacterium]|nr:hypothetical protein [Gammaproteobacteria bacterium]
MQSTILILGLTWLGLSLLLFLLQSSYIYYPVKEMVTTPALIDLEFEEVQLNPAASDTIFGWYVPHLSTRAT